MANMTTAMHEIEYFPPIESPIPPPSNLPHQKAQQLIRRFHPYARNIRLKSGSEWGGVQQPTLHATRRMRHGASRLVQAISAWPG